MPAAKSIANGAKRPPMVRKVDHGVGPGLVVAAEPDSYLDRCVLAGEPRGVGAICRYGCARHTDCAEIADGRNAGVASVGRLGQLAQTARSSYILPRSCQ